MRCHTPHAGKQLNGTKAFNPIQLHFMLHILQEWGAVESELMACTLEHMAHYNPAMLQAGKHSGETTVTGRNLRCNHNVVK